MPQNRDYTEPVPGAHSLAVMLQADPDLAHARPLRTGRALQVAEYHEALKEAMGMGSVAVGVKALHIR